MIITFGTQKGGVGKTTLCIAFANYLVLNKKQKVVVYDFDFQKSFYEKWKEDELIDRPKLYDVFLASDYNFTESDFLEMKESETIYLFDLGGQLNADYSDLLISSSFIVIPFEYSDVSVHSTMVFISLLGMLGSDAQRIFIRSKYDKGFSYPNQEATDNNLDEYGEMISAPVYKRNILQTITTKRLNYEELKAVKIPFDEMIKTINHLTDVYELENKKI